MEKLVVAIAKNTREELRVELTECRGHHLVSMHAWDDKADESGKVSTPNGITGKVPRLPAIVAAQTDTERETRAAGLLDGQTRP